MVGGKLHNNYITIGISTNIASLHINLNTLPSVPTFNIQSPIHH